MTSLVWARAGRSAALARMGAALAAMGLVLMPSAGLSATASSWWQIRNGYWRIRGKGTEVRSVCVDPSGGGHYSRMARSILLPRSLAGRTGRMSVSGGTVVQLRNIVLYEPEEFVRNETTADAQVPIQCPAGGTLTQTLQAEEGFCGISVCLPTWITMHSSITVSVRRGGLGGPVIASERFEVVRDCAWVSLTFEPQAEGLYAIELSDPGGEDGTVGWWITTGDEDLYASGQAYENGVAQSGRDFFFSAVRARKVGTGDVILRLDGSVLRARVYTTGRMPDLSMRLGWRKSGYDIRAGGAVFRGFFSAGGQYVPAEQLKRRSQGQVYLAPSEWVRAIGHGDFDLTIEAQNMRLDWRMKPDAMDLVLQAHPHWSQGEQHGASYMFRLQHHMMNWRPAYYPVFYCDDGEFARALNDFYYERAFSFPPGAPAPWLEWFALMLDWVDSPLRAIQRDVLDMTVVGDDGLGNDGYVYTWGNQIGLPSPYADDYDTRRFDTCAKFVLGVYRYYSWTGDAEFLKVELDRVRRAMEYQLGPLQGESSGLIVTNSQDSTGKHESIGSNYWDLFPFGHLDAYCNIYFYASLLAMKEIEAAASDLGLDASTPPRSQEDYDQFAQTTKDRYTEVFWDSATGRFLGCVDVDGDNHDYGFTFVNLEAMAYGLASPMQAKRIYEWMETQPTSSGQRDTYSRWVFAPRSNTRHDPPVADSTSETPGTVPSWWVLGFPGTAYGDQCQNGGAILYTSFYDILARARLLDVDNAMGRLGKILKRYRMPDRLCGGAPLYRGEIPQDDDGPGQVGVDFPFPESGLVPASMLYAFIGADARPDGLHVRPNLPRGMYLAGVRNLSFRNRRLDVGIRRTPDGMFEVGIVWAENGQTMTWRRVVAAGAEVVFRGD